MIDLEHTTIIGIISFNKDHYIVTTTTKFVYLIYLLLIILGLKENKFTKNIDFVIKNILLKLKKSYQ